MLLLNKLSVALFLSLILSLCSITAHAKEKPKGMVWIPKGSFWMGSNDGKPNERPAHSVSLDGFWIDSHPVTNQQFAQFVQETGYVTFSERELDPKDFPGVPKDKLVSGSAVFKQPKKPVSMNNYLNWWEYVPGASWKHPEGAGSNLKGRENHPVVHVTYEDALAYAKWSGKQIPTEAQWEYAARGGMDKKTYTWGNKPKHLKKKMANIWQGDFPYKNKNIDGYTGTSPVKSFPANEYGLYDMAGNVWEWTQDWYHPDYFKFSPKKNPIGVEKERSLDPNELGVPKRITKGGSFLCSEKYCTGYRPSARMASDPKTSLSHTGFRCVVNPNKKQASLAPIKRNFLAAF